MCIRDRVRSLEWALMEKSSIFIFELGKIFKIDFFIFSGSSEGFIEQNISILHLMLGIFILSNFGLF